MLSMLWSVLADIMHLSVLLSVLADGMHLNVLHRARSSRRSA